MAIDLMWMPDLEHEDNSDILYYLTSSCERILCTDWWGRQHGRLFVVHNERLVEARKRGLL